MNKPEAIENVILALNTVGFVGYLLWLSFSTQRIFYTQEGVIYLLPCLPFFFVYVFLLRRRLGEDDEENED